jgi:hypothetical protein
MLYTISNNYIICCLLSITAPQMFLTERIIYSPNQSSVMEAITKMPENPGIPPLFREMFKNAYLPYRDPETLRSFLKIIDEFTYDHSENLGDGLNISSLYSVLRVMQVSSELLGI